MWLKVAAIDFHRKINKPNLCNTEDLIYIQFISMFPALVNFFSSGYM